MKPSTMSILVPGVEPRMFSDILKKSWEQPFGQLKTAALFRRIGTDGSDPLGFHEQP